jgi:hypothetical protein
LLGISHAAVSIDVCAPVRSSDTRLLDAELFEIYSPYSPIHRVCGSPTADLDDEFSSGPSPLFLDGHVGNVASLEVLRDSISDDVEGFGLDELFVEAPVDPEVYDFLANLAPKK